MAVKYIKMKDKDELIADIQEEGHDYVIDKPIKLVHVFYENKNYLTFKEYVNPTLLKDTKITISKYDVLFTSELNEKFAEEYLEIIDVVYNPKITKADEDAKSVEIPINSSDEEDEDYDLQVEVSEEEDDDRKVLSFYEALMKKNDKIIH